MEFTVLDLSDDFFDGVEAELVRGFKGLKAKLSKMSKNISKAELTKCSVGDKEFQSILSCDLYTVFEFARGKKASPGYVHEVVQNMAELAWNRPFIGSGNYSISWSKWQETHHGFLCKLALDRIDLVTGKDMQKSQIANLVGLSRAAITQQLDVEKPDPVTSRKKKIFISNNKALEFIKSKEIIIKSGPKEYKPYKNL